MSDATHENIPSADEVSAWADESAAQIESEQQAAATEASAMPEEAELERLADPE